MRRITGCGGIALVTLLLTSAPAQAVPIGSFSWDGDDFLFGPVFTVENLAGSGGSFFDVFVDLTFNDGTSDISLSLGDIAAGEFAQSIEDLSPYISSIEQASLRFAFELRGTTAAGSLFVLGDSQVIDFEAPSASVPEPSTLLLTAIGIAGAAWRRRRYRRSAR